MDELKTEKKSEWIMAVETGNHSLKDGELIAGDDTQIFNSENENIQM